MEVIAFTKTKLPFGWLGNMSPYPIEYNDKIWRTTEALFQALRFPNPEDEDIVEGIRANKSPMGAKFAAKKYKDKMSVHWVPIGTLDSENHSGFTLRSDINNETSAPGHLYRIDISNMTMCLILKLEQHPELKKLLLETSDTTIIEDCTKRGMGGSNLFWGAVLKDDEWVGENNLGKIWMKLRDRLKEKES